MGNYKISFDCSISSDYFNRNGNRRIDFFCIPDFISHWSYITDYIEKLNHNKRTYNDPFMGVIVDNTHTEYGKFKPWICIGVVLVSILMVLLFTDFGLSGTVFIIVFGIIYIAWKISYTMNDISYFKSVPKRTREHTRVLLPWNKKLPEYHECLVQSIRENIVAVYKERIGLRNLDMTFVYGEFIVLHKKKDRL